VVSRKIIFIFLCLFKLNAELIEVQALNFYSDENSGKSILSGNVIITYGKDVLKADKLIIYTDKKRKALKYEAMQNASFSISLKDKLYRGSGDKFIYDVLKDTYEIEGNAYIQELTSDKKLYGDRIIIERKNNIYRVQSTQKKPSRFVFEVEQK